MLLKHVTVSSLHRLNGNALFDARNNMMFLVLSDYRKRHVSSNSSSSGGILFQT